MGRSPALAKRFRFLSLNTDMAASTPIMEANHVGALPTLLCFVNGRLRGRFVGLQTADELKAFLEEMIKPLPR